MNTELTSHDIFWLARYAHNTLAPLVKLARDYEPSFTFSVGMNFDHPDAPYLKYHHLDIYVRAEGQSNTILTSTHAATTTDQIDGLAAKVRDFIQTSQAALEAAADAAAEADYDDLGYEVSDEDIQDWDAQQERIRERAEMERDEDARDIELQNIAAGN